MACITVSITCLRSKQTLHYKVTKAGTLQSLKDIFPKARVELHVFYFLSLSSGNAHLNSSFWFHFFPSKNEQDIFGLFHSTVP